MSFDKKVMQRRSDIELLEMTTLRQNDYLPEAVEAAKMELESRALSPEKMKELRQRLLNKNLSKAERKQQKKHAEELLNEKSNELIDSINPLTEKKLETSIRTVAVVLGVHYFYILYTHWFYFPALLNFDEWDLSILPFLIPILFIPIGLFGFIRKKIYGWIIMTLFAVTEIISSAFMFAFIFNRIIIDRNDMFPYSNSPMADIVSILIFGGFLYFLNKKDVLKIFRINKNIQLPTVIIPAIILIPIYFSI